MYTIRWSHFGKKHVLRTDNQEEAAIKIRELEALGKAYRQSAPSLVAMLEVAKPLKRSQ